MQYVPVSMPDRKLYIIDDDDDDENDEAQSDIVRLILNLPYLKEEDAIKFSFDKSSAKVMKQLVGNMMKSSLGGGFAINK